MKSDGSDLEVVRISTNCGELSWDRYVLGHPNASGYHLMAWRHVVEKAFGHKTVYLMANDESGEVRGVLPLVLFSNRLFGSFMVSMPFLNYGGVLADSSQAQGALLKAAVNVANELGASHIELRQQGLLNMGWPCKQHKVSMRLDLPSRFESLRRAFPSKLRSQIRRPQKEGMRVGIGGLERLDDFYQVFARGMRDLGTPVYSKRFFETIVKTFPKETRICIVYWNARPVAGGIVYGFRHTLEIPWACSDRRYDRMAPNMLLYSSVLEYACLEGFTVFDFGRSTPGSGTYRFKEQWGARPVQLYWSYWLRNGGKLPELNPQNEKYGLAITLWKHLPIPLTKIIGPVIVRSIP